MRNAVCVFEHKFNILTTDLQSMETLSTGTEKEILYIGFIKTLNDARLAL